MSQPAVLFILGPSAVGKSFITDATAAQLFGSSHNAVILDGELFREKHAGWCDVLMHGTVDGTVPAKQRDDSLRGATLLEIASKNGRVVYALQKAAPTMLRLRGEGGSVSTPEPLEKEVEITYDAKTFGDLEPRFERIFDIQPYPGYNLVCNST